MNRKIKNCLTIFFVLSVFFLCVAIITGFYYLRYKWNAPIEKNGKHVIFEVKKGESFLDVVNKLKQAGILEDTRLFYFMGKILKVSHKIKAGEFLINTRWSQKKLLNYLVKGRPYLHKVMIPEGSTWWEVGNLLEANGILRFSDFKAIIFNKPFLEKMNIPGESAEGYLYPDTYYFEKGNSFAHAREVVETMIDEFWEKVKTDIWLDALPKKEQVYRVVILASLVEKEALYDFEKPIIAGVFLNRLKRNMPLQCDPTIIYGLGPGFDGNLKKRDLKNKNNPYNTYIYRGLPPTPICSPSIKSIQAVVHPAKHSYLYFVAKGDGTHKFSTTLKEHNKAVFLYQKKAKRKKRK